MIKINWGCGDKLPVGWINIDHESFGNNIISDIKQEPLPFEDGTVDLIVANHALSMLDYQKLPVALKEFNRVLKKDGVLRVIDFDPIQAFEKYIAKDEEGLIIPDYVESTIDCKFCAYLTWYGTRLSLLTPDAWLEKLAKADFFAIETEFGKTTLNTPNSILATELDSRESESNFVEGLK